MRNWGDAVRIWAAFSVGVRLAGGCPPRSGGCHRLPPSANVLPLSAKTCHPLPRAASSLRDPWRSMGRRLSSVFNGCVGIVLMGLMLWHGGSWKGTGMRSVTSDLLRENEAAGHPRPVTVCHINPAAWCRMLSLREARPSSSPIPSLALRADVERLSGEYSAANKSPNRQRENRETQTTPFAGRATRPTENEEHGLPGDGKTVAPWIHGRRPAPREGRAPQGWCASCPDGAASAPPGHPIVAQGCDRAHLWCSLRCAVGCFGEVGDLRHTGHAPNNSRTEPAPNREVSDLLEDEVGDTPKHRIWRQNGENSRPDGDIGRQQTTDFRRLNGDWRRCVTAQATGSEFGLSCRGHKRDKSYGDL